MDRLFRPLEFALTVDELGGHGVQVWSVSLPSLVFLTPQVDLGVRY